MPTTDPPPEWRFILADAWVGWLRPVLILAAVALLAAAYLLGWFSEPVFARLLAAVVALVILVGATLGASSFGRWPLTVVAGLLALGWAAAMVVPVWWMVAPGEPAARVELARGEPEEAALPEGQGVTILVRARPNAAGDNVSLTYDIALRDAEGGHGRVEGELSRKKMRTGGTRGGGQKHTLVNLANTHTLPWVGGGPLEVRLVRAKPADGGVVSVELYRRVFPWTVFTVAMAVMLVLALGLYAWGVPPGTRCLLVHAGGILLAFAVVVRDELDPTAPVKPLFGSIVVALIVGAVGGSVLSFLIDRLPWRKKTAP